MLTRSQAAHLAGMQPATLSAMVTRGQAPAPDQTVEGKPFWEDATIRAWLASRPGQGRRDTTIRVPLTPTARAALAQIPHGEPLTQTRIKKAKAAGVPLNFIMSAAGATRGETARVLGVHPVSIPPLLDDLRILWAENARAEWHGSRGFDADRFTVHARGVELGTIEPLNGAEGALQSPPEWRTVWEASPGQGEPIGWFASPLAAALALAFHHVDTTGQGIRNLPDWRDRVRALPPEACDALESISDGTLNPDDAVASGVLTEWEVAHMRASRNPEAAAWVRALTKARANGRDVEDEFEREMSAMNRTVKEPYVLVDIAIRV